MQTSLPLLYSFRRCPYAMRARLALAISQTPCVIREVILRDKPAELLSVSPKGTVPVLVLADRVIEHSLDIMLWALKRNDPESWLKPSTGTQEEMLDLIAQCDGEFKQNLDRYKYPERYPGEDPVAHREHGSRFLAQLETRLASQACLFGSRPALADRAIAPFVRQFAHTDKNWFSNQPWPGLQRWLQGFLDSTVFAQVMEKYPQWRSGDEPTVFAPD